MRRFAGPDAGEGGGQHTRNFITKSNIAKSPQASRMDRRQPDRIMQPRRRRTDHLPAAAALPTVPVDRARAACDAVAGAGFTAAVAIQVPGDGSDPVVWCSTGRAEPVLDAAKHAAVVASAQGRVLHMPDARSDTRIAVVDAGDMGDGQLLVVTSDAMLSRREGEALACWLSPGDGDVSRLPGASAASPIAQALAAEFDADAVVFSLFGAAGMLMNLHVRSGGVLRSWRLPEDTIWGEAGRHSAAFMLGDLHVHAGAEAFASLGLTSAAVVGLENGNGVAAGSVGLAAKEPLALDCARQLLDRAGILGPELMQARTRAAIPIPSADGSVELRGFARRVGCRRFALYAREGNLLRLMAAHSHDGSTLVAPPDPYEEQLVCWAAEKGIAIVSDDAAAVLVGETVLYAQDPSKRPMERLRLALQDLQGRGEDLAA
jgi:hypothetical protein